MSETTTPDDLDIALDDLEIPLDGVAAPVAAPMGLVEVLPADFPLPRLLKFCPDVRLKAALDQATAYALAVDVAGPDGLAKADVAVAALRTSLKAVTEAFEEPKQLANRLHKGITSTLSAWCEAADLAIKTVGRRMALEQSRLEQLEREARRKAQEEEDRKARESARLMAEEAARQQAPAAVVEQMREQAKTATAPPVPQTSAVTTALRSSSVVKTWKCRIAGTAADAEPLPDVADMTEAQWAQVVQLLQAVIAGTANRRFIAIDASYANTRAKADKQTFSVPGLEAWEDSGIRSKGGRGR